MKSVISKIANCLLTALIIIQAIFCVVLMVRSSSGASGSVFGYRFYYIVSPSMEPTIGVGSQIVVKETDVNTLEVGDIITFASRDPELKGYPNTHRIVEITEDSYGRCAFVTKGDNNDTEDPYLVYTDDIYGEVVAITPALKGIIMFYSFASTPIGFIVVVVMPLLLVFGIVMRSLVGELKKGAKEENKKRDEETNQMELISDIVSAYVRENPDRELSSEEANRIAGELLSALARKGDDVNNGR